MGQRDLLHWQCSCRTYILCARSIFPIRSHSCESAGCIWTSIDAQQGRSGQRDTCFFWEDVLLTDGLLRSEGKSCLTGSVLNGEKLKKSISDPLISSFLLLSSVAHVWPVLFNAGTDMTHIPILYFDFCPGFVKYIKTKLICFWNNKHRYLYSSAKCTSAISNVIYTLKHVFTQAALVWPKFAFLQQN